MEKGKNFSCSDKENRKESDAYPTHYSLTEQLLEKHGINLDYSGLVLEPCCGENNCMTKILANKFKKPIESYDLYYGENKRDFFDEDRKFDYVITNPPFNYATEFLLKAKTIATKQVIFFLRVNFLQGIERFNEIYKKYDNYRLKHIYQFTRMVDMSAPIREDGKYTTAMLSYFWGVWENGFNGEPVVEWINNQSYVFQN